VEVAAPSGCFSMLRRPRVVAPALVTAAARTRARDVEA
jgi:hypothetical protein